MKAIFVRPRLRLCLKDPSRVPQMGYLGYNRSAGRNRGDARHDTPL